MTSHCSNPLSPTGAQDCGTDVLLLAPRTDFHDIRAEVHAAAIPRLEAFQSDAINDEIDTIISEISATQHPKNPEIVSALLKANRLMLVYQMEQQMQAQRMEMQAQRMGAELANLQNETLALRNEMRRREEIEQKLNQELKEERAKVENERGRAESEKNRADCATNLAVRSESPSEAAIKVVELEAALKVNKEILAQHMHLVGVAIEEKKRMQAEIFQLQAQLDQMRQPWKTPWS